MPDIAKQLEKALFEAALNLPEGEVREKFLDDTCRDNAALRTRLGRLLGALTKAESFFNANAAASAEKPGKRRGVKAQSMAPGESSALDHAQIGRYKLERRLGEGGCGVVYEAEQMEPVKRRVALKIIRLGMDTERVIARFEMERQALALMNHPNIAQVLDAGATETGRPYFVMELVPGERITDYCRRNRLKTGERLELFIQVCHAIQHAHQKGILHRDIKPSNVLVALRDGEPTPKVIDFGIAKAIEGRIGAETSFTYHGQLIGTPAYMSPEQIGTSGMDVDTRSDIYSLGALLYELLTGRPPFDTNELMNSGIEGMRRNLLENDPPPPSQVILSLRQEERAGMAAAHRAEPARLLSSLRGDLDWVVMKALEKNRSRRYATVNSLALDVQRYLNGEPVNARPPDRLYRFGKFVRRNKVAFAAGAVVLVSLMAGLGISSWLFVLERDARREQARLRNAAEIAEREATEARRQAEDREKVVQAAFLVNQGKLEEADRMLDGLTSPPSRPSLDGIAAFRWVAEWLMRQGRWEKAADRFGSLLNVHDFEDQESTTSDFLSYGVLLARAGRAGRFDELRKTMIARYAGRENHRTIERILRISLLMPADADTLGRLATVTQRAERYCDTDGEAVDWMMMSVALSRYRTGNHAEALRWARLSLEEAPSVTLLASARLIQAMALKALGRDGEARPLLEQGREAIEGWFAKGFRNGDAAEGFWFDWVFADVLLQQALELEKNP